MAIPARTTVGTCCRRFRSGVEMVPRNFSFGGVVVSGCTGGDVPAFTCTNVFCGNCHSPAEFFVCLDSLGFSFQFVLCDPRSEIVYGCGEVLKSGLVVGRPVPHRGLVGRLDGLSFLVGVGGANSFRAPDGLVSCGLSEEPVLAVSGSGEGCTSLLSFVGKSFSRSARVSGLRSCGVRGIISGFRGLSG